jgi:hypothetical protein
MGRKSRAEIIRDLMDSLRLRIEIVNEADLRLLQKFEFMEEDAIEEDTDEAVDRIRRFVLQFNRRVYALPSIGKRFEVVDGKIVKVTPLK